MSQSGSCQCGQVRYEVAGEPLMTYVCYCFDCQKRTGSAFSMGAIYPLAALAIEGDLSAWERRSEGGVSNVRYSCSHCGNIIYGIGNATADLVKLQPGTLDDTSELAPDAHIWTRSAQAWVQIPDGALRWDTQPDNLFDVYTAVMENRAK